MRHELFIELFKTLGQLGKTVAGSAARGSLHGSGRHAWPGRSLLFVWMGNEFKSRSSGRLLLGGLLWFRKQLLLLLRLAKRIHQQAHCWAPSRLKLC